LLNLPTGSQEHYNLVIDGIMLYDSSKLISALYGGLIVLYPGTAIQNIVSKSSVPMIMSSLRGHFVLFSSHITDITLLNLDSYLFDMDTAVELELSSVEITRVKKVPSADGGLSYWYRSFGNEQSLNYVKIVECTPFTEGQMGSMDFNGIEIQRPVYQNGILGFIWTSNHEIVIKDSIFNLTGVDYEGNIVSEGVLQYIVGSESSLTANMVQIEGTIFEGGNFIQMTDPS